MSFPQALRVRARHALGKRHQATQLSQGCKNAKFRQSGFAQVKGSRLKSSLLGLSRQHDCAAGKSRSRRQLRQRILRPGRLPERRFAAVLLGANTILVKRPPSGLDEQKRRHQSDRRKTEPANGAADGTRREAASWRWNQL